MRANITKRPVEYAIARRNNSASTTSGGLRLRALTVVVDIYTRESLATEAGRTECLDAQDQIHVHLVHHDQ